MMKAADVKKCIETKDKDPNTPLGIVFARACVVPEPESILSVSFKRNITLRLEAKHVKTHML
jgi:hypothetical protein